MSNQLEIYKKSSESSEGEDASTIDSFSCSSTKPKPTFNEIESAMINSVIEETIFKLIIVNMEDDQGSMPIVKKPAMHIRFDPSYKNKTFSENQAVDVAMGMMILVKLKNDISNLRRLLSDTHEEMAEYGTFETLQTFMDNDVQSEKEEHQLIRDSILNEKKLKALQVQLDRETKHLKALLKQLDDEMFDLETKSQDIRVENDVKSRLVHKWENTRHQQAQIVIQSKENDLLERSKETRENIERELRLKSEIDVYISYCIDQINEKISFWVDKYQREVKAFDKDIMRHKDHISELKVKFEEMTALYKHREKEIKICAEFRKEREKQMAFADKQLRSAIKIQAWWRGTMVRKGLGPFKKKKKSKPTKSPKKGGKKSK
ncbi:dynein regulatory complex protein 9-like isoform X2 [Toxorhynchites rutilus septentrionalis]|uniref:dynein regulatory complex protein 9-like isoform X2 n=1 Tax=Toxorhynchites rutilus septentrionalis TaxID=329112 RepID=UPI0024796EEA|nr:dynein regulatory complex protein 9-like isoform X2 [Toxorhynchites rutilus septentrionalis]